MHECSMFFLSKIIKTQFFTAKQKETKKKEATNQLTEKSRKFMYEIGVFSPHFIPVCMYRVLPCIALPKKKETMPIVVYTFSSILPIFFRVGRKLKGEKKETHERPILPK